MKKLYEYYLSKNSNQTMVDITDIIRRDINEGELILGRWQEVYFCEFD